jgi:hypothetical protein
MLSIMFAHNCIWCVWTFLQPDARIIFCCRLERYTGRYYYSVVDGGSARDTTTKDVGDGGYLIF